MMRAEPPHGFVAVDDVVKERIQHLQDDSFEEDGHFQEEADGLMAVKKARLRLYQVAAKGWPTKVKGISLKSVGVPGAALATVMGAVVFWGLRRRRTAAIAAMGDEMLEHTFSEEI